MADAGANTYDYTFPGVSGQDYRRTVAHNYDYHRAGVVSAFPYVCTKLTRTSDGSNYGDTYCNYGNTGHHYAGDTGTYPWARQTDYGTNYTYTLSVHDEW